jgi:hypothetical protein
MPARAFAARASCTGVSSSSLRKPVSRRTSTRSNREVPAVELRPRRAGTPSGQGRGRRRRRVAVVVDQRQLRQSAVAIGPPPQWRQRVAATIPSGVAPAKVASSARRTATNAPSSAEPSASRRTWLPSRWMSASSRDWGSRLTPRDSSSASERVAGTAASPAISRYTPCGPSSCGGPGRRGRGVRARARALGQRARAGSPCAAVGTDELWRRAGSTLTSHVPDRMRSLIVA